MTKKVYHLFKWSYVLLGTLFILGCSGNNMNDLQQKVAEVKARKNPHVEPIPEFKIIAPYFYEVENERDPFKNILEGNKQNLAIFDMTEMPEEEGPCTRPNINRLPQELERMPLDALQMIGTLEDEETNMWGLVKSKMDGTVYKVQQDEFMGQNYGQIISVTEQQIELREMYPDGQGCFVEQITPMVLYTDG